MAGCVPIRSPRGALSRRLRVSAFASSPASGRKRLGARSAHTASGETPDPTARPLLMATGRPSPLLLKSCPACARTYTRSIFLRRSGRMWWSQTGSNRRHPACKADALPTELWPRIFAETGPALDCHPAPDRLYGHRMRGPVTMAPAASGDLRWMSATLREQRDARMPTADERHRGIKSGANFGAEAGLVSLFPSEQGLSDFSRQGHDSPLADNSHEPGPASIGIFCRVRKFGCRISEIRN